MLCHGTTTVLRSASHAWPWSMALPNPTRDSAISACQLQMKSASKHALTFLSENCCGTEKVVCHHTGHPQRLQQPPAARTRRRVLQHARRACWPLFSNRNIVLVLRLQKIVTQIRRCHVSRETMIQSMPESSTRFFRFKNPNSIRTELRSLVSESRCNTTSASRFTSCADMDGAWLSVCSYFEKFKNSSLFAVPRFLSNGKCNTHAPKMGNSFLPVVHCVVAANCKQ